VGQKINAYALRLGINQTWQSYYFPPKKEWANWLHQDKLIRDYLFARFPGITQIKIERTEAELIVIVHSPNISLITGENNDNSDVILAKIAKIVNDKKNITKLRLVPERNIYSSAQAIANDLAQQLKNRISCRLALRNLLIKLGQEVKGIRICLSGRLDGAEIAQSKITNQGKMPSSTLSSLIEYGQTEASTTYGQIGITVQIYKGKRKNKLCQF